MGNTLAALADSPRKRGLTRWQLLAMIAIPVAAILFQVYVPRFLKFLAYLELPLLVTVYLALRRSPVAGLLIGAAIGLTQDSLAPSEQNPLGMFGIVKTMVGYFAATFSQRFAVENSAVRGGLGFFFYFFHEFLYWVLARALLGQPLTFAPQQVIVLAMLNAAVAAPMYRMLDRLKVAG
jgi:rod shape-determining protein MreD